MQPGGVCLHLRRAFALRSSSFIPQLECGMKDKGPSSNPSSSWHFFEPQGRDSRLLEKLARATALGPRRHQGIAGQADARGLGTAAKGKSSCKNGDRETCPEPHGRYPPSPGRYWTRSAPEGVDPCQEMAETPPGAAWRGDRRRRRRLDLKLRPCCPEPRPRGRSPAVASP